MNGETNSFSSAPYMAHGINNAVTYPYPVASKEIYRIMQKGEIKFDCINQRSLRKRQILTEGRQREKKAFPFAFYYLISPVSFHTHILILFF